MVLPGSRAGSRAGVEPAAVEGDASDFDLLEHSLRVQTLQRAVLQGPGQLQEGSTSLQNPHHVKEDHHLPPPGLRLAR